MVSEDDIKIFAEAQINMDPKEIIMVAKEMNMVSEGKISMVAEEINLGSEGKIKMVPK